MATCRGQRRAVRVRETSSSAGDPELLARGSLDLVDRAGRCGVGRRVETVENLFGELGVERAAGERAEGDHPDQRALERADVER